MLALAPLLVACGETKPQFKAIDVTGAEYARDFQLTDHEGRPRTLKDFRGKAVVVFFGYTQCPDVCPVTLTEIAEARKLGATVIVQSANSEDTRKVRDIESLISLNVAVLVIEPGEGTPALGINVGEDAAGLFVGMAIDPRAIAAVVQALSSVRSVVEVDRGEIA